MQTAWWADKPVTDFLRRSTDAPFSRADLLAATGTHEVFLYPLLTTLRHHGWIAPGCDDTGCCWVLTQHGRDALAPV